MPPQQNNSGNQYDFIISPGKPPKKSLVPSLGGDLPFGRKLVFIIGGGLVLIILIWIVASLLGGGSSGGLTRIVQQETEIARVATEGSEASRADIKNAAVNTQLSLTSQRQAWLQFLANRGTTVSDKEQKLLANPATDQQLETARSNNAFDKTFLEIMRSYLTDYSAALQQTFASSIAAERELLQTHFDEVQLLLEQLPKS
ncbi:MAG: hypothetical protein ACREGD_04365 [Candidatus Saccharimonadales bacterium]